MKLIITIDTEGDNQWSEKQRGNITTENALFIPPFQELCEEFGYKPTYLTSYEMTMDKYFIKFARGCLRHGSCEIGCHPHAWSTPPAYDLSGNDSTNSAYLFEYPQEIIYQKVKFLTDILESTFEVKMASHRAGRWGFNEPYAQILNRLGYMVDCSVTPFVSWKSCSGALEQNKGKDFTCFPTGAYFLDLNDISQRGESGFLELPMTIRRKYSEPLSKLYTALPSRALKYIIRAIFGPQVNWFRCCRGNIKNILKMLESELESSSDYIEFMLHSSELMPGGSPSFGTEDDINNLYNDLKKIFEFLSRRNVTGMTCREFYSAFKEKISKLHGN